MSDGIHFALLPVLICCLELKDWSLYNGKRRKIVSEKNQEIPQSQNRRQTHGTARKSQTAITRHQGGKLSKATSSLVPIKMIAKLKWTKVTHNKT